MLTVRGVFSTPIYQLSALASDFFVDNAEAPTSGSITIRDPHPASGIPQEVLPLVRALAGDDHPALLLVGPLDDWVVVEVDVDNSNLGGAPDAVTLAFVVGTTAGLTAADRYVQLSGGFPLGLRAVTQVGTGPEVGGKDS